MWLLQKRTSVSTGHHGQQRTEPSRIVRLLLRKRYTKLGPVGDYTPGKSTSFRFGIHRKSKQGDGTSDNKGKEQVEQSPKIRRSVSTSSVKRTVVEKFGDAYVDMIWSAASHAVKPIGAKPKVPSKRAVTFEKMFGEPHDTVLRDRSYNSIQSQLMATAMTAQVK